MLKAGTLSQALVNYGYSQVPPNLIQTGQTTQRKRRNNWTPGEILTVGKLGKAFTEIGVWPGAVSQVRNNVIEQVCSFVTPAPILGAQTALPKARLITASLSFPTREITITHLLAET